MKKLFIIVALALTIIACNRQPSKLTISKMFNNHMVLQRDIPVNVWGTAIPGTKISVTINNKKVKTQANADSTWLLKLPVQEVGGPYEFEVKAHDTIIQFINVMYGDVWVCSGQSNMEWELSNTTTGMDDLSKMNHQGIRYLSIEKDKEFKPLKEFRNETKWKIANNGDIARFSAVGFYFGKEIHYQTNVPIGLIGSNWGGTVSEAWTSYAGMEKFTEFKDKLDFIKNIPYNTKEAELMNNEEFFQFKEKEYYKGIGMDEKWFLPTTNSKDWKIMNIPSLWDDIDPELKDFDGEVWFRREFDVPASFKGKDLKMWFGQINDHDIIWVNGEKVGETFHRDNWRGYNVAAKLLKERNNTIVIRVYNVYGKGGFSGINDYFDFYPVDEVNKKTASTAGIWQYKKGSASATPDGSKLLVTAIGPNSYPCCLYNAMIHPMIQYGVKGAIWYQGESNADRAYQYRELFPALINDWRAQWGQEQFDFYFVQLANFMERLDQPKESDWAELREAQTMTLQLPRTGMATIIDIGEANDIHPRNKIDVGKRLALNALHTTYGKDIVFSGPMYASHEVKNDSVIISFNHTGSGLITNNDKNPVGFSVAGEDKVFHWASAVIKDNKIILTCKEVKKPVAARYAWANNPETNLYNQENLPAVPFRTDQWEGITFGKK